MIRQQSLVTSKNVTPQSYADEPLIGETLPFRSVRDKHNQGGLQMFTSEEILVLAESVALLMQHKQANDQEITDREKKLYFKLLSMADNYTATKKSEGV
jgi:hypothetical protein